MSGPLDAVVRSTRGGQSLEWAGEKIGPNQSQVIRSADHRRNLLEAIRSGQKTICPIEVAVRDQTVVQQEYIALSLGRSRRALSDRRMNHAASRARSWCLGE